MGLRSWAQGHGWDGTKATPTEQHITAMHAQVETWKAQYADPARALEAAEASARARDAVRLSVAAPEQLPEGGYGYRSHDRDRDAGYER